MGWLTDILKDIPLNAVLREKIAEADRRIDLLQRENQNLKVENAELKLDASKEPCPKCRAPEFNLVSSRKHPIFGEAGIIERAHVCAQCGFAETREVDSFTKP